MQKKPPILLIALVLGIIAVGGTALLLTRGSGQKSAASGDGAPGTLVALAPTPTPVPEMRYIANRDIPPRTTITSDMLRRTAFSGPKPLGAITSLDDVRGMLTRKTIRSGDTVTEDALIAPLDRVIPANFTIPSGFRAVAIYVDPRQTAAGLVDIGDRVDVLVTQKLTIDKAPNQFVIGTKEFTAGHTVGTNLLVLAVEESLTAPLPTPTPPPAGAAPPAPPAPADGAAPPPPPAPADGAPPPANNASPNAGAAASDKPEGNIRVILAAPLETASRLVAANDSGILHVVVRNPLDGDSERAPEVREYPSRTITIKNPNANGGAGTTRNQGGSGGGRSGPAFPIPDLPDVTVSQNVPAAPPMPMPIQASAPSSDGGGMTAPSGPPAPQTRDVMVVRGTEKTRVIVPKR